MRHKNPLHLIVAHIKIAGSNKKTQGFSPFLFKHVFYCWENWKWIKVFVYVFFNIHAVSLEQRTNHKRISDIKYQTLQIAPSQFNFEDGGDFSKGNNIYMLYTPPWPLALPQTNLWQKIKQCPPFVSVCSSPLNSYYILFDLQGI